jgi:hypothetical protein
MRTLDLGGAKARGRVALVDDGDYDTASAHRWRVKESTRPGGGVVGPYVRTEIRLPGGQRRTIYLHTLLTGWARVDHRNGDPLDNQRHNLREATNAQNGHNRSPDDRAMASGFKGVTWDRQRRKWRARIMANGARRSLGHFADEAVAARAYDEAASELHGEFARLNFPTSEEKHMTINHEAADPVVFGPPGQPGPAMREPSATEAAEIAAEVAAEDNAPEWDDETSTRWHEAHPEPEPEPEPG